jgi:glyoxylase-like metal-dependent hydrolase (beta-lactamase superfamily II)
MAGWTDLGSGIRVRQSARYAMNSVVLLDQAHTVIVDPGILPSELDDLAAVVRAGSPQAVTMILTHAHWDHVLGQPWWPDAETLAHDACAGELRGQAQAIGRQAEALARAAGEKWPQPFAPFRIDHAVSGIHFRMIGPWRLVFRSAPGHCDHQINVHLPEHGVLIAADMLSDLEIPDLHQPPDTYRESLDALLPLAHGGAIQVLIPGHGAIVHGREAVLERFRADLDYLDLIEVTARDAVRDGRPVETVIAALADLDYRGKRSPEYPTEPIHEQNIRLAYAAATAGLEKSRAPARRGRRKT